MEYTYTDVYFTLNGLALAGLLIATALACYPAYQRYRHRRRQETARTRLRQRKA